jgi:two-component system sensor histidine kinase KdpD
MVDPCVDALRVLGHALRGPLTVLRGAATLLVNDADRLPAATRGQMLGLIDGSATAMTDLIDDLLTAVHLELGDLEYRLEPVDLRALIEEGVETTRRLDGERAIVVTGLDDLEVEVDREQAARALRAVLANAVRYSAEGSPIEVAAQARPAAVEVAVLDRGPGIPEAQRERAFEKFSRLDEAAGGAGLGLFLARGLARGMGGDLRVEDREDGGAAVCFTLRRRG